MAYQVYGKKHQAIISYNKALALDHDSVPSNLNLGETNKNFLQNVIFYSIKIQIYIFRALISRKQIVRPRYFAF